MIAVVITGSRSIRNNYSVIFNLFERITLAHPNHEIVLINGGAIGVDRNAAIAAASLDWHVETYPPDWRPNGKYDRAAGHKRNRHMVDEALAKGADHTYGIAFMDPTHPTSGTSGCIAYMKTRRPQLQLAAYTPAGDRWQ